MPFRRGLFHSVLNENVPLRTAVAAVLARTGGRMRRATVGEENVCWWGEMTLAPHLFRFAGLRGVRAEVRRFGGEATERADRFELSEVARGRRWRRCKEGLGGGVLAGASSLRYEAEMVEAL